MDHVRLFNEAVREEGFIGKIAIVNNETVGFSWGYSLPSVKTMTVRFDLLTNIFSEKGLHQKNTFYAAETGIASEYRGKSIGTLLSSARLIEAQQSGHSYILTRTINPYTLKYLNKTIGMVGIELSNDPERSSKWYLWDFKKSA